MNPFSPWISPLLLIPGLAFEGFVRVRNLLYSHGVLTQARLTRPVISIGNISLGGSGKTPLVIHAAEVLRDLGYPTALLSRGYGRRNARRAFILHPGMGNHASAQDLGDEPALIRRRASWMWLGISKDRYSTARKLLERSPDLAFILDDGFQHRKLDRTLDILIIDCSQPLSRNRIFPRGTLREPLAGMCRAQVIMLNLGSSSSPPAGLEPFLRKFNPSAALLHCRQTIESVIPFPAWKEGARVVTPAPPKGRAFLVAAIGNPERFRRAAEHAGIAPCGLHYYRDHYSIGPGDWRSCSEEARMRHADFLLTTEKDAVKVADPPSYPLMVAMLSVHVQEEEEFRSLLKRCVGGVQ